MPQLPRASLFVVIFAGLGPVSTRAQQYDPALYSALRWRMIGPFRGGRTVAAVGVPGSPDVLYIGVNNGGVWRSGDYGRTWSPIFDGQATGSIGAIAVAPSDPQTLYVGTGEGLQRPDLSVGDGVYRSTDGGATWSHRGLRDSQQIPALLVDPRDPRRVFAAVLGHPYGPNEERGLFRSTNGGETWQKVLYKDENTGAVDVAVDPANPETVFAVGDRKLVDPAGEQRALQVGRWRHHVATGHRGAPRSGRWTRSHRPRRGHQRSRAHVCGRGRNEGWGAVPVGRLRRALAPHERGRASVGAGRRLQ